MSKEIKFKTITTPSKIGKVNGPCHGCVIHNKTLGMEEIAEDFAIFAHMNKNDARCYASYFIDYLVHAVSEGYSLNLGSFLLYLSIQGGIEGANGSFDPKKNKMTLNIRPFERLKNALSSLRPVNATLEGTGLRITSILDVVRREEGVITAGAKVLVAGSTFNLDASRDDEGAWLEDDDGEKIASAAILSSTATTLDLRFNEDTPAGDYRIAIYTRMGDAQLTTPAVVKRRVTVMPAE